MKIFVSFIVIFVVIVTTVQSEDSVDGFQCYICNSVNGDSWCDDKKAIEDRGGITQCPLGKCYSNIGSMGDVNAISRGCAMGPPFDTIGCQEGETLGINGEYCVCDTPLCNFDITNESTSTDHQKHLALHCFILYFLVKYIFQ